MIMPLIRPKLMKKSMKMSSKDIKLAKFDSLRAHFHQFLHQFRVDQRHQACNAENSVYTGDGPEAYIPDGVVTVLDFISLFLDEVTMRTFADETNAYATSIDRNVNSRR